MYLQFYGLRELPFELTPDPKYLYLTSRHREALSTLRYGLAARKCVTLLLGLAGTGKTTLLHAALGPGPCNNVRCVFVSNPALTRAEFIQMLADRFHLSAAAAQSKAVMLSELERVLRQRRSRGEVTALVIDEAQALSAELLEEIRLLANIETTNDKLLPLILAGQPELARRLEHPDLRQLKQRIALRCDITPFTLFETAAYISARVQTAGAEASALFTREAVALIHECSGGIPRTINVMCDNALVSGFALDRRPVDQDVIAEVARDFSFMPPVVPPPVGPAEPRASVTPMSGAQPILDPPKQSADTRELFADVTRAARLPAFGFGRRRA